MVRPHWFDPYNQKRSRATGRSREPTTGSCRSDRHLRHGGRAALLPDSGRHPDDPASGQPTTSSARPTASLLSQTFIAGAVADQGLDRVQAARDRIPSDAGLQLSTTPRRPSGGILSINPSNGHPPHRRLHRRAGSLRRLSPAQRLGPLRLRFRARRHPAVLRRISAASCSRTTSWACGLFGDRDDNRCQYNLAVLRAAREGHQFRPQRPRPAAAQGLRRRRQPLSPGLAGPRFHLAR